MGNNFHTPYTTATRTRASEMNVPLAELDKFASYLQNRIVHCDGTLSYVKATGVLTWSGTIRILFNRADGQAIQNTIAASNVTLADNQFAYVTLSETNDAVITMAVATVTTATASNFLSLGRVVLGYRNTTNDEFYGVGIQYNSIPVSDSDKVDGFHASQSAGADQIPVLNAGGRLLLGATDDTTSKLQVAGIIRGTVADTACGIKLKSDTGEFHVTPYQDATYGCIIRSFDIAENNLQPLSIGSSRTSFYTGNVLIGTTTDDGVNKLQVNGKAYFSSTLGVNVSPVSYSAIRQSGYLASGNSTEYGISLNPKYDASVVTSGFGIRIDQQTLDAAFTMGTLTGVCVGSPTKGAASTITDFIGVDIQNCSSSTNAYAFRSNINAGTGTRRNIYAMGTAANYFAGAMLVGSNTDDGVNKLQVSGSGYFSGNVSIGTTSTTYPLNIGGTGRVGISGSAPFVAVSNAGMTMDGTNYERLYLAFVSNVGVLRTEAAGTGTLRKLQLSTGSNNGINVFTSGNVGINNLTDTGHTLSLSGTVYIEKTVNDPTATLYTITNNSYFNTTANATQHAYVNSFSYYPKVATGITQSGNHHTFFVQAMRNYSTGTEGNGTLNSLRGFSMYVGHQDSAAVSPVTNYVDGLYIVPFAKTGTIGTFKGLNLGTKQAGGTITNYWGVYQEDSAAKNYFNGNVLIGTTTDDGVNKLQVAGSAAVQRSGVSTQYLQTLCDANGNQLLSFSGGKNFIIGAGDANCTSLQLKTNANTPIIFYTTAEVARISGSSLLVGTSTDDGTSALQVNGVTMSYGGFFAASASSVRAALDAPNGDGRLRLSIDGSNIFSLKAVTNYVGWYIGTTELIRYNQTGNLLAAQGNISATQYNLSALNTAPSSASDTGTLGEIRVTSGYIYVCTATNTWKRTAIATW